MFVRKLMTVSFILVGMTSSVCIAANQGSGKVTMTGSIISTPCALSPESIDQSVSLGQVMGTVLLEANGSGKSTPRNFSIDLENCDVIGSNSVSVTFSGVEGKDGRLGISGTANGASIAFTDGSGEVIKVGQPSKNFSLQSGNNTLPFSVYLQGDGIPGNIRAGDYQAMADFTMSYQ
ncbi:fimbrial protein [Serratia ureilytica]|uniref:fimbrial protein n=1 Tax=Serratia ureilytica TaxID=300181 RepID=UPI001C120618|nr:fimbrial protein [Serratia ureilytica]MBU5412449.1 type 1 fimbrial protein [Serratia ureilytica]